LDLLADDLLDRIFYKYDLCSIEAFGPFFRRPSGIDQEKPEDEHLGDDENSEEGEKNLEIDFARFHCVSTNM
jgi:hypothetical protein